MLNMQDLKPDWTNRRQVIRWSLGFLAFILLLSVVGAGILAWFLKFTFYISLFAMTLVVLLFISYLGIIGSYIFGARWETKDFLGTIQHVLPDFYKKDTPEEPQEPKDVGKDS